MKQRLLGVVFAALFLSNCAGGSRQIPTASTQTAAAQDASLSGKLVPACPRGTDPHKIRCHLWIRNNATSTPSTRSRSISAPVRVAVTSGGPWAPSDLRSAYNIASASTSLGGGETVAVIDAYNDPNAESDMATYRSNYGLPSCTTANGCFRKVNETGGTTYPATSTSWALEISIDLDMVSAICPNCHIVLVEATTNAWSDFENAENEAVALGANVLSNSWGGAESLSGDSAFDHPGHVIVASIGDNGYGTEEPASFSTVVSVGGTILSTASNARGWSETVWNNGAAQTTGSGCSTKVAKPSWEVDTGCLARTMNDVSAVADNVLFYDSYQQSSPWMAGYGTSVAAPIVASIYALSGGVQTQNPAQILWDDAGHHLNDVTTGNDGSCSPSYLCVAGVGYDGPTGWGTPNGLTAFQFPSVAPTGSQQTVPLGNVGATESISMRRRSASAMFA